MESREHARPVSLERGAAHIRYIRQSTSQQKNLKETRSKPGSGPGRAWPGWGGRVGGRGVILRVWGLRRSGVQLSSGARAGLGPHSPCLPLQVSHLKRPGSGAGDSSGTSNGAAVSSTKRHKSLFQCAKCSFATDSGLEFQSHIPQHQADSSTAQCLLCGLCYTSASSLSRHLYIVHKVRDQEEEEEEEEEEDAEAVAEAAEAAEPEEGSGEEVSMETRENGLEEGAGEPLLGDTEARSPGPAPEEDGAQDAQSQPQASQDQDSHAPPPQV